MRVSESAVRQTWQNASSVSWIKMVVTFVNYGIGVGPCSNIAGFAKFCLMPLLVTRSSRSPRAPVDCQSCPGESAEADPGLG